MWFIGNGKLLAVFRIISWFRSSLLFIRKVVCQQTSQLDLENARLYAKPSSKIRAHMSEPSMKFLVGFVFIRNSENMNLISRYRPWALQITQATELRTRKWFIKFWLSVEGIYLLFFYLSSHTKESVKSKWRNT